jgi:hypothetical protein
MKAYLIVTGFIFALMAVVHIWKAIAEWNVSLGYLAGMGALVFIPAGFSAWAWLLLRTLPDSGKKSATGE